MAHVLFMQVRMYVRLYAQNVCTYMCTVSFVCVYVHV